MRVEVDATRLKQKLSAGLRGQEEAIDDFAQAVALAWAGPPREGRCRALVLLLGPTGVGKTELVRLSARHARVDGAALPVERLDMAEYQHPDAIHRLLGGAGQPALLAQAVDRLVSAGGGFLLLDEIEKAHRELSTVLLSFEAGRFTPTDGRVRDLSPVFVALTSNLGAAEAARIEHAPYATVRRQVLRSAEQHFRPEVLARFSRAIVLRPLDFPAQREVAAQAVAQEVAFQVARTGCAIEAGEDVVRLVLRHGFSRALGARPVRQAAERLIGEALLRIRLPIGNSMRLEVEDDALRATPLAPPDSLSCPSPTMTTTQTTDCPLPAAPAPAPAPAPVPPASRQPSLIRVEVLDFGPLRDQAVAHYCTLVPERAGWTEELRRRLVIRTECRWARVVLDPDRVYVLSEKGDGPRAPLSSVLACEVALFASLPADASGPGFTEERPFALVAIDDVTARSLPVSAGLQLEEFIRARIPEFERAYEEWRALLAEARARIQAARRRREEEKNLTSA